MLQRDRAQIDIRSVGSAVSEHKTQKTRSQSSKSVSKYRPNYAQWNIDNR